MTTQNIRERCVETPPADRRNFLQYLHAHQSYQREFQAARKDSTPLLMIYEKLDSGMEDLEDRLEACDCISEWKAAEFQKMQQTMGELHGLVAEHWKKQSKEAGLFIAAICELTQKFDAIQAKDVNFHRMIMKEIKECKNKFTQVHYALSDVTEILGEAKRTIKEANDTMQQIQRTQRESGIAV